MTAASTSLTYNNPSFPWYPDSSTDAQNNKLTYGYDPNGNPNSITDPLSSQNQLKLNYPTPDTGLPYSSLDPNGNTTGYGYTGGNLTSITPPALGSGQAGTQIGATAITPDSLSRPHIITDGKGQTTTYTYDAMDRVIKVAYQDGKCVNYNYDDDGNLLSRTDRVGTTTYVYDPKNRLKQVTTPDGRQTSYTYDEADNLLTLTDAGGTVTYAYDPDNNVSTIQEPSVSGDIAFSYDSNDRPSTETFPNGVQVTDTYWPSGMLKETKALNGSTPLMDLVYSYTDATGHDRMLVQTRTNQLTNATTTYTYDALNRLVEAKTLTNGTQTDDRVYTYDGDGNLTQQTVNGGTPLSLSYNSDNELTNRGTETYSYDADGNLTANSNGLSATYNAQNQVATMTANRTQESFAFLGEGQNEMVSEGSTTFQNNLLGLGARTNDSGGYTYYTRAPDGMLLGARNPDGTRDYYLLDDQGSPSTITDQAGGLVTNITYDPYGTPSYTTNPTTTQIADYAFGLDGGYYSATTGLYHYGARYYSPTDARWTQQDPLNQITSLTQGNRYAAFGDDPINGADPSGKGLIGDVAAGIGYVATIAGCLTVESGVTAGICAAGLADATAAVGLVGKNDHDPLANAVVGSAGGASALVSCGEAVIRKAALASCIGGIGSTIAGAFG